jgi:uncharacterized protein YjbJ (UPF0337 family)
MDKDRIKGKIEDAAGRAKRQVGEWTGDEKAQAEGLAEQAKGKIHNAVGKIKDSARDAADKLKHDKTRQEEEDDRGNRLERDKDVA